VCFGVIDRASAIDLNDVRIGENYYLYSLIGDNKVVRAMQIDTASGAVLVQHVGGRQEWVAAKDLLTRTGSQAANAATNAAVVIGIGALIFCATNPEACKKK